MDNTLDAKGPRASETSRTQKHPVFQDRLHDNNEGAIGPDSVAQEEGFNLTRSIMIYIVVSLVILVVILHEGIITTAIPSITNTFNSLDDVGWYGSSYLFALCAFQLPFGQVYKGLAPKGVFLGCMVLFCVGACVEAASPTSGALIAGRFIAGVGAAGLIAGALVVFATAFPVRHVPYTMGSVGFIYAIGMIVGPILGGIISKSRLTWRWCFWISPIACAVTVIPILILLKSPPRQESYMSLLKGIWSRLDMWGILLFIPSIVCLLLALQYGGSLATWSDARTIACFVLSGVLLAAFLVCQYLRGDKALLPFRYLNDRTIVSCMMYTTLFDGGFFILDYYLPLWFQAVKHLSPEGSAFHTIAFISGSVTGVFASGIIVGQTKTCIPSMLVAITLLTIGCGLLTMLQPESSTAVWASFQIIAGLGAGSGTQLPLMAVQDHIQGEDVSTVVSIVVTCGYLGTTIAISLAQAVFASRFSALVSQRLPSLHLGDVRNLGATDLYNLVPPSQLAEAIRIYSDAVTDVFYLATALSGLAIIGAVCIPWRHFKGDQNKEQDQNIVQNQDTAEQKSK